MPRTARSKPRILSAPVYRGPIPRVKGPKLNKFPGRGAHIVFRKLLSDPESEGQAHVFEVTISSRVYALKVFKFYDEGEADFALDDYQKEIISLDLLQAHADPFYNECRAYGRLREAGLNGKVAVRCHGYTTLPPAMESELEERFDVTGWDRDDYDDPTEQRAVFRALVKDLIEDDVRLTHRVVKKMKKDLEQIRKLGIYPSDIKRTNYKNGLLIDFSSAITEPNYYFDIMQDSEVEMLKKVDLNQFDQMIKDEKIKTWIRGADTQKEDYRRKLRPRL